MTNEREARSGTSRRREEDLAYDVIEAPDLTDHPMILPALPQRPRLEDISDAEAIDVIAATAKDTN